MIPDLERKLTEAENHETDYDAWSDTKDDLEEKLDKLNEKADDAREKFIEKLDNFNFAFADKILEQRSKGYDPNQPRTPAGEPGGGRFAPVHELPQEEDDLIKRLRETKFVDEGFPDLIAEAVERTGANELGDALLQSAEELKAAQMAGKRAGALMDRCEELRDQLIDELKPKKKFVNRIKGLKSCLPSLNGKHK